VVGLVFAGTLVWWLMGGIDIPFRGDSMGDLLQSLEPGRVEHGRDLYLANCSQCHGVNGEGQPNWLQRNPDGTFLAPPHDSTGHTWHHSDGLLFRIVREGGKIYEDPGFKSMMPAFGDTLNDEEIQAVITYLKILWDPEQRDAQAEHSVQDPFPQ